MGFEFRIAPYISIYGIYFFSGNKKIRLVFFKAIFFSPFFVSSKDLCVIRYGSCYYPKLREVSSVIRPSSSFILSCYLTIILQMI